MGKQSPGSEGAEDSSFQAKGHPTGINLQKTSRDGAEHGEGEAEAQGTGDEEHDATTRDQQGTGPPVEAGRGGIGHADGGGRQREEGTPGRDYSGADRDLIA